MDRLSKGWKITLTIIGILVFLTLMFLYARPYKPEPRLPATIKSAEQIEKEDLVKKIQSGSSLWADHTETIDALKRDLEVELTARAKVERYVADYRDTLCHKFGVVLSGSGTQADPSCATPIAATVDFQ